MNLLVPLWQVIEIAVHVARTTASRGQDAVQWSCDDPESPRTTSHGAAHPVSETGYQIIQSEI